MTLENFLYYLFEQHDLRLTFLFEAIVLPKIIT